MKDHKFYYIFILERIEILEKITADDIQQALMDEVHILAIERALETISDATKHIPDRIKNTEPGIQWSKIKSFRNRLAHDYTNIDSSILLEIIEDDIPKLKEFLKTCLKNHG
jgi:Uncharacterized conserved protein